MNVTKRQLELFHNNAHLLLSQKKGQESKLLFKLRKVIKKTTNLFNDYMDEIQEIRIDHASVDEKGNVIQVEGNYKFTPEKVKELTKKIRAKEKELIEIEPHFVDNMPEDLPLDFREVFENFVLREQEEPSEKE
ncbi:MAG: hypothetical protein HOP30_09235 [Cyclobacteriaceae bacterium]|nr:hypothetical protein [Cyclobacteriaceae bacterium]